jgi:hypothetical protein
MHMIIIATNLLSRVNYLQSISRMFTWIRAKTRYTLIDHLVCNRLINYIDLDHFDIECSSSLSLSKRGVQNNRVFEWEQKDKSKR